MKVRSSGSRAGVLRRSEGTCFSSPSDRSNCTSEASTRPQRRAVDEVGRFNGAIRAERAQASGAIKLGCVRPKSAIYVNLDC